MAFERLRDRKVLAINLGSFINSQLTLVNTLTTRRNLEDESRFSRAVLEDDLNLEQQLEYRNEQLKRVRRDKDERRRVKDEIASLKDRIVMKDFTDDYISQIMTMNDGLQSIDNTINWLEKRMVRTTDEGIKSKIKTELLSLKKGRYDQRKNALTNQTTFAVNNKTESVLSTQLTKVNDTRNKAMLAGNDDYVALLDLQVQALNKSMSETKISDSMLSMAVSTATGQSALSFLNKFNDEVENADPNVSINIGGTKFDSAQQYWSTKRGEYLNDKSANGFFGRYKQELAEKVSYKKTRGILTNESLGETKEWFEGLKTRPELSDYQDQITFNQQDSLKQVADLRSTEILNRYALSADTSKTLNELSAIQDSYGIDQTLNYQKVVTSAASEKEDQVRSILSTMGQIMSDNPGVTNQEAMNQAISAGAGAFYSKEELATAPASDIITEAGEKATKQQFGEADKLTAAPGQAGKFPQYKEGGLYQPPGTPTVYKYEGGKLRALEGDWDADMLKQATGKGYEAVEKISDIAGVPVGESIKAVEFKTPESKFQEGSLYKAPKSNTVFRYEKGKLRGFSGQWDEAKLKEATGGKGFKDVNIIDKMEDVQYGDNIDITNPNTWKMK